MRAMPSLSMNSLTSNSACLGIIIITKVILIIIFIIIITITTLILILAITILLLLLIIMIMKITAKVIITIIWRMDGENATHRRLPHGIDISCSC